MLSDAERKRIYEEECAKRAAPMTPTDQLSSCIMGCVWIVVGLFVLAGLGFVALCIKGAFWPVYN